MAYAFSVFCAFIVVVYHSKKRTPQVQLSRRGPAKVPVSTTGHDPRQLCNVFKKKDCRYNIITPGNAPREKKKKKKSAEWQWQRVSHT